MPSVAAIIEDHPESLTFGVLLVTMDVVSIGTLNAAAVDPVRADAATRVAGGTWG